MKKLYYKSDSESGYTVIEVLVSLIILLIVVIPLTQFIGYLLSDEKNIDKINATYLAEREMEHCIINRAYENNKFEEIINGRHYLIKRNIENKGDIIRIKVEVLLLNKNKILTNFETLRRPDFSEF